MTAATILLTIAGVASNFKTAGEFTAFLGLYASEDSTWRQVRLLGISQRVPLYSTLLINGAQAAYLPRSPVIRPNTGGISGQWNSPRGGKNKTDVAPGQ